MDIHPQTLDPRRAGLVRRYHVWPMIQEQNVAAHTWQLMRIMLALWPDCPRELLQHAMFHDIGEVVTGDIPYPVKAGSPAIRKAVDELDMKACRLMGERFLVPPIMLDVPEVWGEPGARVCTNFFKLCEYTEMWEQGLFETNLGNRYFVAIAERMWSAMQEMRNQIAENVEYDPDLMEIIARFDTYVQERVAYEFEIKEGADHNV